MTNIEASLGQGGLDTQVTVYNRGMRRAIDVFLIVGFLAVDFLFFHDVLKRGEVTTPAQYMTGFLSILVIAVCGQSLLRAAAPR